MCNVDITPLALVLALTLHSIFEGIALGLLESLPTLINLAIGVMIHKTIESISLTITLKKHKQDSWRFLLITLIGFGFVEPIGIGIGMALKDTPLMTSSILMALAGGTFIYIGCNEILAHEFDKPENRLLKILSLIVGGAIIVCLWFLHGEH